MEEENELDVQEALGILNQSLDKAVIKDLMRDVNNAIEDVVVRYGLRLTCSAHCRWTPTTLKAGFEAAVRMHDGKTPAQITFERYAGDKGYKAEWFGRKIIIKKMTYVVSGVNPRRNKNAIMLTRELDGKKFKCSVAQLIRSVEGKM